VVGGEFTRIDRQPWSSPREAAYNACTFTPGVIMRRRFAVLTIVAATSIGCAFLWADEPTTEPATKPTKKIDVRILPIKGHEYIIAEGSGTCIIHSESCKCKL
jgi:hypothetical protein